MSPAGTAVSLLPTGRARWFSQRLTPRPFVDCMFAALCTPLSFMGYDLPPSFVGDLREASGVPRTKPNGEPQGTSTAHTRTALRKLIPDCPIEFGGLPDEVMLTRLADREIVVRVMARNQDLPQGLRRFVGRRWKGVHAVALAGARPVERGMEVLWMDPMGLPLAEYSGQFVPYEEVREALLRTPKGNVRATWGRRDAALPERFDEPAPAGPPPDDPRVVLTGARINEFASIERGTPFLHPTTREVVTSAARTDDFRLAGRSTDDRFFGVWVNTKRLAGAKGMTLLLVEQSLVGRPFVGPGA